MANSESGETKVNSYVHGTKEWAYRHINLHWGCECKCTYCYAMEMGVHWKYLKTGKTDIKVDMADYRKKCYWDEGVHPKAKWDIMYPTLHNIGYDYLESHLDLIGSCLMNGNRMLLVLKPSLTVVRAICESFPDYRDQFLLRFSIGTANASVLKVWEPHAPTLNHRLKCLHYAFNEGFQTSVSMEPLLNDDAEVLIDEIYEYCTDSIWIGRINNARRAITMNVGKNSPMHEAYNLLELKMTDDYYWSLYKKYKKDPYIKWKDSLKDLFGLKRHTIAGLDM